VYVYCILHWKKLENKFLIINMSLNRVSLKVEMHKNTNICW